MMKLYGGRFSRASIVRWYLEELALPYEFVQLNMQAGEHRQEAFLAINPFGKVPALVDGEFTVWESGAILLYLADKYTSETTTPEDRALCNQWILFANATLGPGVFVETSRDKEMPKLMSGLNQILQKTPFLLGESFGVADVAVGSLLAYIPMMLKVDLSEYEAITAYMKRLNERPACQKAMGNPA
jgi:glutathione S-transferase